MIERYSTGLTEVWSRSGEIVRLRKASLISARAAQLQFDLPEEFFAATEKAIYDVSPGQWTDLELMLDHDLAAWVEAVRSNLDPEWHRWWHRNRTSSDLAETALALGLNTSIAAIREARAELVSALAGLAVQYRDCHVLGRTHGQEAEPTTIGRRFALLAVGVAHPRVPSYNWTKLSGPVGAAPPGVPDHVYSAHGLRFVESTQIVPRWHLAEVMTGLIELAASISRVAIEIRLGSQTGIDLYHEVSPRVWARGSSAMPHKRNPIRSERASGLARLVRSNAMAVVEASAELWNERDISHSSVERTAMVDALVLTHFLLTDLRGVVDRLAVDDPDYQPQPTGTSALNARLDQGEEYGEAYRRVQLYGPDSTLDADPDLYDPAREPKLWRAIGEVAHAGRGR